VQESLKKEVSDCAKDYSPMRDKNSENSSFEDLEDDSNGFKHEAAERLLLLLRTLTANICTRKEIFEQLSLYYKIDDSDENALSVSHRRAKRLFERDIEFLDELGYTIEKTPVVEDKRVVRYHIVLGTGPSTQFLFSQAELDALIVIYTLFTDPLKGVHSHLVQPMPLQPPRHPFSEEVLALIERFIATLPKEQRTLFDQSVRKPYIYFNITPVTDYLPYRDIIDAIVAAIVAHRSVSFLYASSRGKKTPILHERVDPYYVNHIDGHFYVIGYSYKMQTFYEYRLDRIDKVSLKQQPHVIDSLRQQHPIEFRYWADEDLVHSGLSQRWLSQVIERDEEYTDEKNKTRRRFLVRAYAYSDWRILQQLRKYAQKVVLVEPAHLRNRMRQELEQTLHLYQ